MAIPPPSGEPPPLLEAIDLTVTFAVGGGLWRKPRSLVAVDGVHLTLQPGETLGIVGESGCGKSTLGRALLGLVPISRGRVLWRGEDVAQGPGSQRRAWRRELQIIFQDPLASLNPRMTILEAVAEPLRVHRPGLDRTAVRQRVVESLASVGLGAEVCQRYPHEFSGGQCQRIGIARAMVAGPKVLICDEPVSALDVSIQAQIVNLLRELQHNQGLALAFISHDLGVVRHISQRIAVFYLGRVVEVAPRDALFGKPHHPYTRALLSAIPIPDPDRPRREVPLVAGVDLPSPLAPPKGCAFHPRCPFADQRCRHQTPTLETATAQHRVACHHWRQLPLFALDAGPTPKTSPWGDAGSPSPN